MDRRRLEPVALLVAWALVVAPLARAAEPAPTAAVLLGKLTSETAPGGLGGAVVVAYHLATGEVTRSSASAADGRYEIPSISHGYYDLAVETADGLYVVDQVVNVPASGKVVTNLHLTPAVPGGEAPRDFPASDQAPIGQAAVGEKSNKKKGALWGTSAGVAAMLLISLAGDDSGSSSPTTPSP